MWGHVTTSTWDQAGRLGSATGPGGARAWEHDGAGRVETERLGGLVVADPAYDGAGRLAGVSYPAGAGRAGKAALRV